MTKEQYIDAKYDEYLRYWGNIGLAVGPAAVLSLIPLDYFVTPANFVSFFAYRVVAAFILFLLYLGNKIRKDRGFQSFILIAAGTTVSLMVAAMIAKFHGHQSPYFAGFILTAIFVSGVLPTLFRASIVASGMVYAIYLIPLLLYDRITNIAFFASANFLILACMGTMLLMRYFSNKHLIHEFGLQYDVAQYKNTLEEQVEQRTAELSITIRDLEAEMLERERIEKELMESQESFKRMSDDSPLAIAIVNEHGTVEYVNKRFSEIMGYSLEDMPALEHWWSQAYTDNDKHDLDNLSWRVLTSKAFQGERIGVQERKVVPKNGMLRDVELRITRAADKLIVVFDDVTDRLIMQQMVRQARDDWEDTFNTINEAITIHDLDFTIIRMNKSAETLLASQSQDYDIIGQKCYMLYHGTSSSPEGCPSCKTLLSGEPSMTEVFEPHLGKYLEIKALPRMDGAGKVIGMIHIVRDITERQRAQAEQESLIQQQQDLLNKISVSRRQWLATFDSITDMISIQDMDATIIKANKAFARYFGLDIVDVLNKNYWEFFDCTAMRAPDIPEKLSLSEWRPTVAEFSDPASGKILRFSIFPYYSITGELVGTVHVARDITEERDREMRLILSERLASLGQMASGIAHEINNPLATIAGCSEGLMNRVKQGRIDSELFENYLTTIQEEVMRCKSITTGMLAVVRNSSYATKNVDMHELIDKTVELIVFQGRLRDVEVVKNYTAHPLQLHGSEGELKQAILAILTNALDAMQERGMLQIGTEITEQDAVISIRDTGPGIAEEHMRRIFDPFFSLKLDSGGTGLGLSIANRIINNHNGRITVDSIVGKGATFSIVLPLHSCSTLRKDIPTS